MNAARASHGLPPLRLDRKLTRAARAHSADMLRRGYFAHGRVAPRLRAFHVRAPSVGENLAWGIGSMATAESVVARWLASPRHRAILLRRGFRRVGIGALTGTFVGNSGALVVTADFAGH
jgi:uncharacterized protein YkwD